MARFEPFAGLRYREDIDHEAVIAPPYDVIDDDDRERLAARGPYNAVRLEVPVDEGGDDRYAVAARLLREWQGAGVLFQDPEPGFYLYRMGYRDEHGRPRQTNGVLGALELSAPGEGDVLPHEETTPKAKSDRLQLLEATRCNLSPIWCLSLAKGLGGLVRPEGPPVARGTDEHGVHHRLWRVTAPALVAAVTDLVASAPIVIADGHHRYETALAYRRRRRAENGDHPGPYDLTMALMVELSEEELAVRPIHRLFTGLPDGLDVVDALSPWFDAATASGGHDRVPELMEPGDALGLVLPAGRGYLLRPRPGAFPADLPDLDSSRVEVARSGLPEHDVAYQHSTAAILSRVRSDPGAAGLLLRPATVAEIASTAHRRERMPPKTTYFHPKPRTGLVFRLVDH
ncbi:MAG: DUF1015 domain-containing protein [Actinobacteria bacterium]|nr:DUF1015 domain-containing protein [Actinomycetota bacterium]